MKGIAALGVALAMGISGFGASAQQVVPLPPPVPRPVVMVDKTLVLHASLKEEEFGRMPNGAIVKLYTLENGKGLRVQVMNFGATLVSVETPDRGGVRDTITLRLGTFAEYLAGHPSLGSMVGRFANRIGGGGFEIDGTRYDLKTVNAQTGVHIHGGAEGFARLLWEAAPVDRALEGEAGIVFTHRSPDGHEGYPGSLTVKVAYLVNRNNELRIHCEAVTDKATHVNLTNHAYWNLAGAGSGTVLDQVLTLHASEVLEVNAHKIPTGKRLSVVGTAFDFLQPTSIGTHIAEVAGGGHDHCYVLDGPVDEEGLRPCAKLADPKSGRAMEVLTTQPGVQVYMANYLSGKHGWKGRLYGPHHAVCLETQHFPDSPNRPEFPPTLLRPGDTLRETTVFRFSVEE